MNFIEGDSDVLTRFLSTQFSLLPSLADIGGGVIADERHSGSLHVYFSRPVNRTQFIAGKVCGVLTIPIVAYILPTVILWLFALGLSPPVARIAVLQTGPSAILIACVGGILIATTVAAVSALVTRARTASVLYAAGLIALTAIAESGVAVGQTWVGYLSPRLKNLVLAFHGPNSAVISKFWHYQCKSKRSTKWSVARLNDGHFHHSTCPSVPGRHRRMTETGLVAVYPDVWRNPSTRSY